MIVSKAMCLLRFTATWSDRVELTQDRRFVKGIVVWLTFKEYGLTARGSRETCVVLHGWLLQFLGVTVPEDPRTLNKVVPRESNAGRRVCFNFKHCSH